MMNGIESTEELQRQLAIQSERLRLAIERAEKAEDERDLNAAEAAKLREALVEIRDMNPTVTTLMSDGSWRSAHRDLQRIARLALQEGNDV